VILEILQWLCLLALFASRTTIKRDLDRSRIRAEKLDKLIHQLLMEEEILSPPNCKYCYDPNWFGRERLTGGQWVHYNDDGRMKFCLAPEDGIDQRDQTPPDSTNPHGD